DGHVVGLGNDLLEFRVGHAPAAQDKRQVEDRPGHRGPGQEIAIVKEEGEANDGGATVKNRADLAAKGEHETGGGAPHSCVKLPAVVNEVRQRVNQKDNG